MARALFDEVAKGLGRDEAELQGKTCAAMASKPRLRQLLRKALEGTDVCTPLHARDLGVDAAPGQRRTKIQQGRVLKARTRAGKIPKVGLRGRHKGTQARSLVASTAYFGVETTGMAAHARRTLRVAVARIISPGRGAPAR